MKLVVGIESPISSNPSLLTLSGGKLILARDSPHEGARIALLPLEASAWLQVRVLLTSLLSKVEQQYEVVVWSGSRQDMTYTRALGQCARLSKLSFDVNKVVDVHAGLLHCFGSRRLEAGFHAVPFPADPLGHRLLVGGSDLRPEEVVKAFPEDMAVADRRGLAPSRDLLTYVIQRSGSLLYEVKDPLGRTGVVVVWPGDNLSVLEAMLAPGEVLRGERAGLVWQRP